MKTKEMSPAHVDLDEDLLDGLRVSTVRLPINHKWGDGPDLWYETMVFPKNSYLDLACERYTTEEEAQAGHDAMVARVEAGEFVEELREQEERYS